jgi:hypothetical protein
MMTEDRTRHMLRVAAYVELNQNAPVGSAYLYAIAIAYLAAPEDSVADAALQVTLNSVADDEEADSDEILNFLLMQTDA